MAQKTHENDFIRKELGNLNNYRNKIILIRWKIQLSHIFSQMLPIKFIFWKNIIFNIIIEKSI